MIPYAIYPLIALALGGAGAALRMWQLGRTDGDFLSTGDPASIALLVLSALAAALFLFLAHRARGCQAGGLYTGPARPQAAMLLVSAALLLVSAMLHLKGVADAFALASAGQTGGSSLLRAVSAAPLELLLTALSVPAVVCIAFLAKDAGAGGGRSMGSLTVIFPVLFCWVWLIDVYRRNTSDPILWNYVPLLLAVIALLLAALGRAGFSFGDGRPRFTIFTGLCALYLVPAALVRPEDLHTPLTAAAMTLYVLAALTGLLRDRPMPAAPAGEDPDPQPAQDAEQEPAQELTQDPAQDENGGVP